MNKRISLTVLYTELVSLRQWLNEWSENWKRHILRVRWCIYSEQPKNKWRSSQNNYRIMKLSKINAEKAVKILWVCHENIWVKEPDNHWKIQRTRKSRRSREDNKLTKWWRKDRNDMLRIMHKLACIKKSFLWPHSNI